MRAVDPVAARLLLDVETVVFHGPSHQVIAATAAQQLLASAAHRAVKNALIIFIAKYETSNIFPVRFCLLVNKTSKLALNIGSEVIVVRVITAFITPVTPELRTAPIALELKECK